MKIQDVIPRDAIPSIDDPSFGTEYFGANDDTVIVVESDPPRAYPVRILSYHEIVNDVLDADGVKGGGDPIAVTWCPLCGSAVVYDRLHEGHMLEFGVSGKLADDDLVMYDRETGSEWKQSSGKCINGFFEGESLSVRSGMLLSHQEFQESYPDGLVLQPPGGKSETASTDDSPAAIEYDDVAYDAYFSQEGFGLAAHRGTGTGREWNRNDDLFPKTVVLGIGVDDDVLGFPLPRVKTAGGIEQTTVGGKDIVIFATEDDGIYGYEDPGISFEYIENDIVADGTIWNPATGRAADGRQLERLPARRLFAFAWQDNHGTDSFYQPD